MDVTMTIGTGWPTLRSALGIRVRTYRDLRPFRTFHMPTRYVNLHKYLQ